MGASHKTTNMSLPIFAPTDKPSWLGDWNPAMMELDNGVGGAIAKSDKASEDATNALGQITGAVTKAEQAQATAEGAKTTADAALSGLGTKLNASNGVMTGSLFSSSLTGSDKTIVSSNNTDVFVSSPNANTILRGTTFGSHNLSELALKADTLIIKNLFFNGDVNTLNEEGIYYTINGATNTPPNVSSYNHIIVYPTNVAKYYTQIAFNRASRKMFIRVSENDVWYDWKEIGESGGGGGGDYLPINNPAFTGTLSNNTLTGAQKTVVNAVQDSLQFGNSTSDLVFLNKEGNVDLNELALKNPIVITGQNLNNIKTLGSYIGFNLTNAPTTKAYIIKVYDGGGALGGVSQIIIPLEDQGIVSTRNEIESGWSSWRNILGGGGGGSAPIEDVTLTLQPNIVATNNTSGYSIGKFHTAIFSVDISNNPSSGSLYIGTISPAPSSTVYFPITVFNYYGSGAGIPNTYATITTGGSFTVFSTMNLPIGNMEIGGSITYV